MNPSLPTHRPPTEPLQGVVERITYHSEESGYTVARLKAPRMSELVTIVGDFANLQAGQTLQLQGIWREHPKYGSQFQVTQYRETKPATLTGIEKYLGSGLIKGVGTVTAKRIVAQRHPFLRQNMVCPIASGSCWVLPRVLTLSASIAGLSGSRRKQACSYPINSVRRW